MRVVVLGSGTVGTALGAAWESAGHDVVVTGRAGIRAALAAPADVVVLAIPGTALLAAAAELGDVLDGNLLVDATNHMGAPRLHQVPELSAALPRARIARAFCSLGWEVMVAPVIDGVVADLAFCVDDCADRATVAELIAASGLRPVWLGGLDTVDVLDGWTRVWFTLAFARGYGRRVALRVVSESADVAQ